MPPPARSELKWARYSSGSPFLWFSWTIELDRPAAAAGAAAIHKTLRPKAPVRMSRPSDPREPALLEFAMTAPADEAPVAHDLRAANQNRPHGAVERQALVRRVVAGVMQ